MQREEDPLKKYFLILVIGDGLKDLKTKKNSRLAYLKKTSYLPFYFLYILSLAFDHLLLHNAWIKKKEKGQYKKSKT